MLGDLGDRLTAHEHPVGHQATFADELLGRVPGALHEIRPCTHLRGRIKLSQSTGPNRQGHASEVEPTTGLW